jgi:hypothetical protein
MHAQKDQDGTCAVILRLLSRHSDCGEQLASDVPIDKKDWRIFGPRGYFSWLSV